MDISRQTHLWRTGLLLVAVIAAALGAWLIEDAMVKGIAVGVLGVAAPGLLDALRELVKGSGGGGSAVLLVLGALLMSGCGGGYTIAAIAAASDQIEEQVCMRIENPNAQDACIGCTRASTDALICELDDAACEVLRAE